jgi:hypothetical protein
LAAVVVVMVVGEAVVGEAVVVVDSVVAFRDALVVAGATVVTGKAAQVPLLLYTCPNTPSVHQPSSGESVKEHQPHSARCRQEPHDSAKHDGQSSVADRRYHARHSPIWKVMVYSPISVHVFVDGHLTTTTTKKNKKKQKQKKKTKNKNKKQNKIIKSPMQKKNIDHKKK